MKDKQNSTKQDKSSMIKPVKEINQDENLFEEIFRHSVIPIIIHDLELNILNANNSALKLFGYSRDELVGMNVKSLHVKSELQHSKAVLAEMKTKKQLSVETSFHKKDGSAFYAQATPCRYQVGDKSMIHVYIQDISDRKAAEEMLKKYTENLELTINDRTLELKNSLRTQELLVKEIHHRVKNNLQILSSIFNLYAQKEVDPKVVDAIMLCRNNILSLGIVYENIYPSGTKGVIKFEEYVKNLCVHLERSMGANQSIPIILDLDKVELSIDQSINCGLILNEIITNSYKHAFPGESKGMIKLKVKKKLQKVYLSIFDNGVGLPKDFDIEESSNFGLELIQILVNQIKGKLKISNDNGVRIEMEFAT